MTPEIIDALDNRKLNLILFSTEQCNFRCKYCYEDFAIGKMTTPVISGVKNLLSLRVPELKFLHIHWFGGEPLLAKELIYDINSYASHLAQDSQGCTFASSITTNGYKLDLETWRKLVRFNVTSFQISLDGDSDEHDRTRVKANGSGTFNKIWSNIIDFRNSDVEAQVILRLHLTRSNTNSVQKLLTLINKEISVDQRFKIFFKPVERLGDAPIDSSLEISSRSEKLETINELASQLISPLMLHDESSHAVCYAATGNSFVIRPNGHVSKCTVALNDPRNNVGQLSEDGRLQIDNHLLRNWLIGMETGNTQALACPLSFLNSQIGSRNMISLKLQ